MKRKTLTNVADPKQTMKELGIKDWLDQMIFLAFVCGYVDGAYEYIRKKMGEKEADGVLEGLELLHDAVLEAAEDLKELEEEETSE